MSDGGCWRERHDPLANQEFEERFDGVELAGDALERVFIVFEGLLKLLEVVRCHVFGLRDTKIEEEN